MTIVLAPWCPHCVPLSVRHGRVLARRLGARLRLLDIDRPAQERLADRLVRRFGDDGPDYLIPQVFYESPRGKVAHLLTGFSERVPRTDEAWRRLLASDRIRELREEGRP